jgi:hypothetical protein
MEHLKLIANVILFGQPSSVVIFLKKFPKESAEVANPNEVPK